MSEVSLKGYSEPHPHRLKRFFWAAINQFVFPLMPAACRLVLLRVFGARIGKSLVYRSVRVYAPWKLEIGDWSCIGPRVEIYNKATVRVGNHSVISQDAYVCTASHDTSSPVMALKTGDVSVGDACWVASRAVLLPNVNVGDGAVVGCASVVPKDVPEWTVVCGNPARAVKRRELKV